MAEYSQRNNKSDKSNNIVQIPVPLPLPLPSPILLLVLPGYTHLWYCGNHTVHHKYFHTETRDPKPSSRPSLYQL